jgi:hypothetical protein
MKKFLDFAKMILGYYEYPLRLIIREFRDYKKASDVRERVQYFYDNKWGAQIVSIEIISQSNISKKKLSKSLYKKEFINIIMKNV